MMLRTLPLMLFSTSIWAACPPMLEGELPLLRSKERVDLCSFAGQPLLVVNTASHCGFTKQFAGLEALNQRYKEQGLKIIGVPSNDFFQEADTSEEAADVCYVNYGVTFTMTEPQTVRGSDAIALFKGLAEQSRSPKWNFFKYVVGRDGKVIESFSSRVTPDDPALIDALEKAMAH